MAKGKRTKTTEPTGSDRARVILYTICALIAAAGLANATYLTASHLSGETVACLASSRCSEVLMSKYATVGPVPLAALGGVAYFIAFSAATLAAFGYERARLLLSITVGAMFLSTLWLLYLQAFVIKAFCDYCLLSAAMIFALAGIVIITPPRR